MFLEYFTKKIKRDHTNWKSSCIFDLLRGWLQPTSGFHDPGIETGETEKQICKAKALESC